MWTCLKCGYANEDYLIVCVCGQYKKEQQTKLSSPSSHLLWICPSCLAKNSIEQLLCKCSFLAISTEIAAYLENQTSADLYDNIIFNRNNGDMDRAKFLLSYLLKRYPNSKEAISEKKDGSEPQRKREVGPATPEKQKTPNTNTQPTPNMRSHYQTLGIQSSASKEEIKQAYKDLLSVWNPDRFSTEPSLQQKAQQKIKEIDEAYEKLVFKSSTENHTEKQNSSEQSMVSVNNKRQAVMGGVLIVCTSPGLTDTPKG